MLHIGVANIGQAAPMVGNGLGQAIDKGRIIGHIHNRARQVADKLIATEQIGFSILAEEGGLDSVLFHDLVAPGAPGFPCRIRVMEKQVITIGPFEQVGVLVCPLEDGTEPGLVIFRDVSQHRWQFFHLLSGFHLRVVARVPGPLLLEIEAALVNDRCLDLYFARGHSRALPPTPLQRLRSLFTKNLTTFHEPPPPIPRADHR